MKTDIHSTVTAAIVAQLEAGVRPWSKPWTSVGGNRHLRSNGEGYKGINTLILALSGRPGGYWFTYKQAEALGAQVRKGEKSTAVCFFKPLKVEDKQDASKTKTIPLLRSYNVFHQDQIDGLPAKYFQAAAIPSSVVRDAGVDAAIAATGAQINHGGNSAHYVPSQDYIQLPNIDTFATVEGYYGTALHELTHWTGHESRLDRSLKTTFGTKDYAREELVAELGAAFLCAELGVESNPRADHASYLQSWIDVLREDSKAIFAASAAAQKATDFVLAFSRAHEEQIEEAA